MYKPVIYSGPPDAQTLHIEQFQGINESETPQQIEINESPEMLNMMLDEKKDLTKRWGYEKAYPFLLDGKVNGMFEYKGKLIVASGNKLYELEVI